jgi:phytoene dehydrogenase-like protein
MLVVGQHSLHDPTRAPAGTHTLYAYTRCPTTVGDEDEALRLVEERIERFAPGFRALVRDRIVRGPAAIEARNPSMVGGDLGGGAYTLDQQLLMRPHPRLVRHRTAVQRLYMAGASVHPGGGVHGAQGANSARVVLRDLGFS